MKKGMEEQQEYPVLLFFHGGGWVTESVDTYNRVCARMAQSTGQIVVSVEYRLAPEYRSTGFRRPFWTAMRRRKPFMEESFL